MLNGIRMIVNQVPNAERLKIESFLCLSMYWWLLLSDTGQDVSRSRLVEYMYQGKLST